MFDFSNFIDLPFIWAGIIGVAILLYVVLDGFDLGVGIIFPFAPSDLCRDRMMNSIAPFWDGNETWLIMGGGGLFAAFPLAYAVLLPAFYIPIITMLLGLIMRGVAFEFRFKASKKNRYIWDYVFHSGSLCAAFCQGVILGGFVQGMDVIDRNFSGSPFDFATAFSIMTGIAVVFGYALLGSTWLVMKTEDITQTWSRKIATYVLAYVAVFMGLVSLIMPSLNQKIAAFWFSFPNVLYLLPIPIITIGLIVRIWQILSHAKSDNLPFLLSLGIFVMGYLGLGLSFYPWLVPFHFTIWDAAASGPSLSFLLVGTIFILPLILTYTAYCYYVFKGKTSHEHMY